MAIDDYDRKLTDAAYKRLSKLRVRRKLISVISILLILAGFTILILKFILGPVVDTGYKKTNLVTSEEILAKLDSFKTVDSTRWSSLKQYNDDLKNSDTGKHINKFFERVLGQFDARIKKDSAQLYDLRASINPDKPDEILRLARLNDKIDQLKNENVVLKESLKSQQVQFEQSVNNQLSNSRTFYIALITILLPITIKFIMQQFKDYNKE
jgi:hypothetical protein